VWLGDVDPERGALDRILAAEVGVDRLALDDALRFGCELQVHDSGHGARLSVVGSHRRAPLAAFNSDAVAPRTHLDDGAEETWQRRHGRIDA